VSDTTAMPNEVASRKYVRPHHPVAWAPAPLLLVLSAVLFALMAFVAKMACARLPGPEVAFLRFVLGLAACAIAATHRGLRLHNGVGLLLRGAFGGAAVLCYFLAIAHLPVGVATLLNYTAPVFTALFAASFLGEPLGIATLGALSLTTTGVALVIRGTAPAGSLGIGLWQLVGVASAILSGAAVTTIREVRKTDGSWEIFGAFCLGGAVITGVPTVASWITPLPMEWMILVVVGTLSVAAQLLMTYALRYVRAAVAGIMAQLTPVAAMALGWLFLGERMGGFALLGAALTVAGVSWGAYLAKDPAPAETAES
jgi:drug/metabolite transporter (DMT)-like permease